MVFQQTKKDRRKPIINPIIEDKKSLLIFIPFFPIRIELIIIYYNIL